LVPFLDETTMCRFRHLLEAHDLGRRLFAEVAASAENGLKVSTGTIVDATIISAPSSTKNADKARDSEMPQTRKGNRWYFGMKAHFGVDSRSKLIHAVAATPANVADSRVLSELLPVTGPLRGLARRAPLCCLRPRQPPNRRPAREELGSGAAASGSLRDTAGSNANIGADRRRAGLPALSDDLKAAWNAPGISMRARQRLLRALVTDIIADVDEVARELILTIHWRGGQHSQLRVRKPKSGEHGCRTREEALAVMRSMATRWSDDDIATTLNRMGMPTGQGKTWTAHRVSSVRRVNGIHAYRSAEKNGEWLTMSEAATRLGVTHHSIFA
jgi:Transposase DDE domain